MTKLLTGIATAFLLVTPAFAEAPGGGNKPDFATVKQRRLARIDQMRACVAKSTNFDEMKACAPRRPDPRTQ